MGGDQSSSAYVHAVPAAGPGFTEDEHTPAGTKEPATATLSKSRGSDCQLKEEVNEKSTR